MTVRGRDLLRHHDLPPLPGLPGAEWRGLAPPLHPLCARDGAPLGAALSSYIECDVSFLDAALNPPAGLRVVRCTASASLEFSRTPLVWAIPWSPTISATAEAIPPPFRQ
jgi:hypothetical protein